MKRLFFIKFLFYNCFFKRTGVLFKNASDCAGSERGQRARATPQGEGKRGDAREMKL
jgi:hypothetical protein